MNMTSLLLYARHTHTTTHTKYNGISKAKLSIDFFPHKKSLKRNKIIKFQPDSLSEGAFVTISHVDIHKSHYVVIRREPLKTHFTVLCIIIALYVCTFSSCYIVCPSLLLYTYVQLDGIPTPHPSPKKYINVSSAQAIHYYYYYLQKEKTQPKTTNSISIVQN